MNANKKFFLKIGFIYLAYSIASILFLIILSNIIAVIRPEILNNINIATIITAICNYVLPLPILLFLMRKLDSTEIKKNNLGFKTFLKYLCITFTLMWIGNITGTIITNLLSFTIQNDIANPIQNLINSTDLIINSSPRLCPYVSFVSFKRLISKTTTAKSTSLTSNSF